ncbi:amidohydrolase family protein [Paraflavisolibacter sp. H34]|uniref:amidohydrolase family protein n=1 Tax=Huijunlia imazamoxiresistens TaxID=3127457 RepID=UPI003019A664
MIDTHVHIWDLDKAEYNWLKGDTSLLNRTFAIEELEEERIAAGVTAGVLVQAAGNFEDTELMLETARSTPWITGVVGWLPLQDPEATQKALEAYGKDPYFKGVRHQIHDEADPRWLLQDKVVESLQVVAAHNLPYDVVGILPVHLETVLQLMPKVPGLRMVLDHLNQPPIASGERFGKWGELIAEAARHPQLHAKISGLGTTSGNFTGWTPADLEPYIAFALEHFGEDRCFCGGDWPVSLLAGRYTQIWKAYQSILQKLLSREGLQKVLQKNAVTFYGL